MLTISLFKSSFCQSDSNKRCDLCLAENLEGPESEAKDILGLCPTRWTVRASCFQRILDNYAALLQEWTISLDERYVEGSLDTKRK